MIFQDNNAMHTPQKVEHSPCTTNNGLRIGITIGLHHEAETLWSNGIKQNAVFLAEALKHCGNVGSVTLVNTTAVRITPALPWDMARWPTVTFEEAKDSLDVLIELGGQIDALQTDYLKQRGTRLISYCCGFEYVHAMESIIFGRRQWDTLFINQRYDDIWMIPQVANISQSYFEVLRRHSAQVVPFVWDPVLMQQRAQSLPYGGEYRPHPGARRLTVMEPNINVVKFCLYPILIAEETLRSRPDAITLLQVTNAEHIAKNSHEFISLMNQLDIVRQHKAVFLGRHETPQFLSDNTDIVISHQWENALNYFYLEVCWQGYALVHNAHFCADLGYYYAGNDVLAGRNAALRAIDEHDAQLDSYRAEQRSRISRFLPSSPSVSDRYAQLLTELMSRPLR